MKESEAGNAINSRLKWLYKIGGAAALIAGALFLIAVIDLLVAVLQPGATNNWLSPFQDNWLVIIFKLHAGFNGVHTDLLHVFNFLDISILAFVAATVLGLYAALRMTSRIWSLIALAQPFLGIVLFIVTQTAGRSSVMGAVLVISAVMLRNVYFNKSPAYLGMLASLLLFAGDLSAGVLPPTNLMAALFGLGYLLWMTWFFLIALKLFKLGRAS